MSGSIRLRLATPEDAEALRAIYAPYVQNTAITFEYTVPTAAEFAQRIRAVEERFPYLVAERADGPVGYAYVSPFKERAAYAWSVETSIYVDEKQRQRGAGRQLYTALEQVLRLQGILNLNACIAYPRGEDAYLTRDSVVFHRRMGYRWVGEFQSCGYKFDRWYNMVWMEKHIGAHVARQPEVKPFSAVATAVAAQYGIR